MIRTFSLYDSLYDSVYDKILSCRTCRTCRAFRTLRGLPFQLAAHEKHSNAAKKEIQFSPRITVDSHNKRDHRCSDTQRLEDFAEETFSSSGHAELRESDFKWR